MPRYFEQKTSFSSGQVSPDLIGRSGIKAHNEGMLELKNVYIKPSGAIQRRYGTFFVSNFSSHARLVPFSMGGIRGLIGITMEGLWINEENGIVVEYEMDHLSELVVDQLSITYNDSRIYIANPNSPLMYIEFNPMYLDASTLKKRWVFKELEFETRGFRTLEPTRKAPKGTTLTLSDTQTIDSQSKVPIYKITSNTPFFIYRHTNSNTFIYSKDDCSFQIYEYIDPYTVHALFQGDLKGKTSLNDTEWDYSAFSNAYGYPAVVGFHQGRLVLSGNSEALSTIWFSKSGNPESFDYGTGLDDEAIDVNLADGQMNIVKSLVSSTNLIVFTTNGVWSITGSPITPTNTSYSLLTSIPTFSSVQPLQMENSFIYVGGDSNIYQLTPSLDGLFNATNLSYVCGDLIKNPRDMCYDSRHSLLQVVNEDGTLAVMSYYKDSQTVAWSTWETKGKYYGIARVNETMYYCIIRSMVNLEVGGENLKLDCLCSPYSLNENMPVVQTYIKKMLSHSQNWEIPVYETDFQYNSLGSLNLDYYSPDDSQNDLLYQGKYLGLSYDVSIKPLPVSGAVAGASVQGGRLRVVSATFRLQNTSLLSIEKENNKSYNVPLNYLEKNPNSQNVEYSGDVKVSLLGWKKGAYKPSWHIKISEPTNFCLISVNTNIMASS